MYLNKSQITELLPHREPMLLIDELINIKKLHSGTAIVNVKKDSFFVQGHFPGQPVMPGVLIVEAFGQAAAALTADGIDKETYENKLVYLMGIDKARFNLLSELEDAFVLHQKLEPVWGKLKASFKSGKLEYNINPNILKDNALKAEVIDSTDAKLWSEYIKLSDKIIGVDVF